MRLCSEDCISLAACRSEPLNWLIPKVCGVFTRSLQRAARRAVDESQWWNPAQFFARKKEVSGWGIPLQHPTNH